MKWVLVDRPETYPIPAKSTWSSGRISGLQVILPPLVLAPCFYYWGTFTLPRKSYISFEDMPPCAARNKHRLKGNEIFMLRHRFFSELRCNRFGLNQLRRTRNAAFDPSVTESSLQSNRCFSWGVCRGTMSPKPQCQQGFATISLLLIFCFLFFLFLA